ncbi:MAG: hypothetical protein ROZ00_09150 [Denitratisoma sp.]|nr:hypothetical protein [Denitratisoma sp.]
MQKETVVLLHAASLAGPLSLLADRLAATHRVIRVGLDAGAAQPASNLAGLLGGGAAAHLVAQGPALGHALGLAQACPDRISSLALIEPVQAGRTSSAAVFGIAQPVCLVGRILSGLRVHAEMRRLGDALANAEQHFFIDDPTDVRATDRSIAELVLAFLHRHGNDGRRMSAPPFLRECSLAA